jgi:hypothetical protein
MSAALLGKYPVAGRTSLFLLPGLWLAAAAGVGVVVDWGRRRGLRLLAVGGMVVAWDLCWLGLRLATPDPGSNYREAYAFTRAHLQAGERIWTTTDVVYQTYYGVDDPALLDGDVALAEEAVRRRRIWVVAGTNRDDLWRRLEAAGGRVVLRHDVTDLSVCLLEPAEGR